MRVGRLHDIGYDFEKLILAKAPLKFLMYDLNPRIERNIEGELKRRLQRYSDYLEGECYITAGCSWDADTRLVTLRMSYWQCGHSGHQSELTLLRVWPEDRTFLAGGS